MKVLTLKAGDGSVTEIHMLNPGEQFPSFGGGSRPLVVQTTASIVVNRRGGPALVTMDSELEIHDAQFWQWMARLIMDRPTELVVEAGEMTDDVR